MFNQDDAGRSNVGPDSTNRCIDIDPRSFKDYIANEKQLYVINPRSVQDYKVQKEQLYVIDPKSVKDCIVSYLRNSAETWLADSYMCFNLRSNT